MEYKGLRRVKEKYTKSLYSVFSLTKEEVEAFQHSVNIINNSFDELIPDKDKESWGSASIRIYPDEKYHEAFRNSVICLEDLSRSFLRILDERGLDYQHFWQYRNDFYDSYLIKTDDINFGKVGKKDLIMAPIFDLIPNLKKSEMYCRSFFKIIEPFSYPYNPLFDFFSKRYEGNDGDNGPKVGSFGLDVHSALYVPQVMEEFKIFCNSFNSETLQQISSLQKEIHGLKDSKSLEGKARREALKFGLDKMIQNHFD